MVTRRDFIISGVTAVLIAGCGKKGAVSDKVVFASPAPVWWNTVPLIALERDLYSAQKITLNSFDVPTGVKSKEAMVAGNAQMGIASPNAFSVSKDSDLDKLKILGSITQSRHSIAIISTIPFDQIIQSKKAIGYIQGSISEFYLIAFLEKAKLIDEYKSSNLKLVSLSPPGLVTAIDRGEVEAIVAWEPFASQAKAILESRSSGREIFQIRDSSLYSQHIFCVATNSFLEDNKDVAIKVFAAHKKAAEYIEQNRKETSEYLEKYFKFPSGFISNTEAWKEIKYNIIESKSIILDTLKSDLALAQKAGVASATNLGLERLVSELK